MVCLVTEQLLAAYDLLETDATKAGNKHRVGATLTQADISVAVVRAFSQFVQADRVAKSRFPALAAFAARLEMLPEFVAYPVDRE